jgi:capsid portal protein
MTQFDVPNEQQQQILADRVKNLNLEGFQNEINLRVAQAAGEDSIIEVAEKNISDIRIAIDVLSEVLADVEPDLISEPVTDPEIDEPTA